MPVEIDVASEFRYREAPFDPGNLAVFVSQSGETADTLATLRYAKEQKQHVLSIVNVPTSSIARESDVIVPTLAGPEIGVASTKAFTCQLAALACLAVGAGRACGVVSAEDEKKLVHNLIEVPRLMSEALRLEPQIEKLARELEKCHDVLYLGRGTNYPLALEGALKLKEISYIHAEGYAAGELKHGPIALIEDGVPVIAVVPSPLGRGSLHDKIVSNLQEVRARGARTIVIAEQGDEAVVPYADHIIRIPVSPTLLQPIVAVVALQVFACEMAAARGHDIDQPRNLAKSVTVE